MTRISIMIWSHDTNVGLVMAGVGGQGVRDVSRVSDQELHGRFEALKAATWVPHRSCIKA